MKRTSIGVLIGLVSAQFASAQSLEQGLRELDFDKFEAARNTFSALTVSSPSNGNNWYYLGQSYFNLYKADSAAWAYNNGIKAEPNNGANYVGLGELLMAENKKEEAKLQFKKALDFYRGKDGMIKDARISQLVASALVSTDNKITDEALNHIKNALELAPQNYDVLVAAGDVYFEMNNGGEAATQYERAQVIQPKNPKAFTRVAAIWIRVKNAESALADLKKATDIDSNYAPAWKLMSELYYKSKKYDLAKKYYIKYLQLSEASLANKQRFARILFNSKEYEDALNQIIDIQKTDKSDIYLFRLAGYCYFEVGDPKKDTAYYRQGVESLNIFLSKIDPAKVVSNDYEYLGKLYSRMPGKDSLAVANIQKAIEMAPEKTELLKEAGGIYNKLKKFDKAVYFYELYISKANKILPADYYLLGVAAYYGKQFTKADTAFTKLIEVKSDYADGYYWKATVNSNLDPEAKDTISFFYYQSYINMVEATPEKFKKNLIVAYTYMATYYIKKDANKDAIVYLNKILALDPENKTAKEYLKALNGGK